MGSLYQETAWDCYPGVCDESQGHCYEKWKFSFRIIPLVCFGLLTPNLVWVAYINTQLGIATQVYVIKVKVTVTKNRKSVSAQ